MLPEAFFVPNIDFPSFIAGTGFGSAVPVGALDPEGFPRFLSKSFFFSSSMALTAAVWAASIVDRFEPSFVSGTEVLGERWAVPFGSVPGAKNLALSPLQKSVFPRKFLTRCSGRIHPWLREVSGEPGARPRARVHTGEKL